MRKTKKMIWLFLLFALASVLVFMLAGGDNDDKVKTVNMYYISKDSSTLVPVEREIVAENNEELYRKIAEDLIKGAPEKNLLPIMDKDVSLNSVFKEGNKITVDLSGEFWDESPIASYAIVKTFTQFDEISGCLVTVDGDDKLGHGFVSGDDINLESDDDCATGLSLYFANSDKTKLSKEFRRINITDTQPVEQYIVAELIKGPMVKTNSRLLSQDTEILSVETTDGTCYVNFKQDFINKNATNSDTAELIIYSIVNSLTERDNVNNVQFLIDGKKTEKFGGVDISQLLYRKEALLKA